MWVEPHDGRVVNTKGNNFILLKESCVTAYLQIDFGP
jgi:hypothetical protein